MTEPEKIEVISKERESGKEEDKPSKVFRAALPSRVRSPRLERAPPVLIKGR